MWLNHCIGFILRVFSIKGAILQSKLLLTFMRIIQNMSMISPLQPIHSEHFLHHQRLIKVELHASKLIITDEFGAHQMLLNFKAHFSTEQDSHGNLTSLSVYCDRVVHLAHNNPTVLEQWSELLHKSIHKIGFYKDYGALETIGEGMSAKVYTAISARDGGKVVAKGFIKKKMQKKELLALENQIKVLRQLKSEWFPQVYGTYETENSYYIVMEYAAGVNLKELVQKNNVEYRQKKRIITQIGNAIQHLHLLGIVHRDIKPENIIYCTRKGAIKIVDFGFSVLQSQKNTVYSNCGTPGYAPPQFFYHNCPISTSCDVFALGVLTHYLFTGKLPYKTNVRSLLLETKQCKFSFAHELKKLPSLLHLLKRTICQETQRITLAYFLNSPFFTQKQESPNNPEAKLLPKMAENLSSLNTRFQSIFSRERGQSMKCGDRRRAHQMSFYKQNMRLVTDRF